MTTRLPLPRTRVQALLLAIVCGSLPAQESSARNQVRRVRVRVVPGAAAGAAMIDRGAVDKVEEGDLVQLLPRNGGVVRGTVLRVDERTSLVELQDRQTEVPPGTGGEIRVPLERYRGPEADETEPPTPDPADPPVTGAQPGGEPDDGGRGPRQGAREGLPPRREWTNQDEQYRRGQPLLAKSVRPARRPTRMTGRIYAAGEFTDHFESGYDQSWARLGAGVAFDNPFGYGGRADALVETNYRTEFDEEEGANLFVRRMSYTYGGDRFHRDRIQFGRFLQYGFPEFSTIDGVQYSRRIVGNNEVGASLGFMPVPDDDFNEFEDFQLAAWYLWKSDQYESTVLGAGYQKVLHEFASDRNLFVFKARTAFGNGWNFDGRLHVDVPGEEDDIRDEALLVSQAIAHATRTFEDGHLLRFGYRRLALPEIERFEFIRPRLTPPDSFATIDNPLEQAAADDLGRDRYDRVFAEGWYYTSESTRWHAYLSGFSDEDFTGGAAEIGLDLQDLFLVDSNFDVTGFINSAEYVDVVGVRANLRKRLENGSWDVFYQFANHKERDFPEDIDDSVQHRLRASRSFFTSSGWDADVYAEVQVVAQEIAYTTGFFVQRRF